MSRTNAHTRFGSPGSPNRPKRARSGRNHLPRARARPRVHRICRWCSHDDANRGQGGACTVAGDIPLDNAGLELMCFGDIVKRAQENSAALKETICDPRRHDHGGRPDATRERVSHAQEIAHHRQLLQCARATCLCRTRDAWCRADTHCRYITHLIVHNIHKLPVHR